MKRHTTARDCVTNMLLVCPLSATEIARRAGVAPATIRMLKSRKTVHAPTARILGALARGLRVAFELTPDGWLWRPAEGNVSDWRGSL